MTSNRIVAVVTDLMFTVKIQEAAKRAGVEAVFVKSKEQAMEQARQHAAAVIVDLNGQATDAIDVIGALKAEEQTRGVPVLGYVSHVETDLRRAALAKGCDQVLPRSAFSKNLQTILEKYRGG